MRRDWVWIGTLAALFAFPLLFPAQTPFVNDEAMLLEKALRHNADGTLADSGLSGTQGRKYGPLPVWIDQAILLATHDPAAIMSIRIALVTVMLLIGLLWISRTLHLWRWGIIAIAMSPYVWFYARQLWDNTYNIPLSVLCLGVYASFLAKPRAAKLMLVILLAGAMLLVHLMAAPFVSAILIHLLVTRVRDVKRFWQPIGFAILIVLFAGVRYWPQLAQFDGTYVTISREPNSWWFALLGPRVLSGAWLEYIFTRDWLHADRGWYVLFEIARAISLLAFPLVLLGMIVGKKRQNPIVLVCALAIFGQLVLNVITHTHGHPHYYNGTFAAHAILMWIAIDSLVRRGPRAKLVAWAQTASVCAICILLLVRIIRTGGTRDLHFGTTLANQIDVVHELAKYTELSPVRFEVNIVPRSLQVLEQLEPDEKTGDEPTQSLTIRYVDYVDPTAGKIALELDANPSPP